MNKNKRLIYISLLAAQGVVITMLERAIPFPFAFAPGAKLGLANIITLLAIFTLPYKDSLKVVWMRLLISTLLGGTLSTFLYSFAGAFLSYGGMLLVRLLGPKRVSMIGISAAGGILHNVGQLAMASLIAQSFSVMLYLPILSITGIFSGIAVGAVWIRFATAAPKGYGFVRLDVPELTIAVLPTFRGRGIGKSLLERMLIHLRATDLEAVALSVSRSNPARKLYERHGFHVLKKQKNSCTMLLELT